MVPIETDLRPLSLREIMLVVPPESPIEEAMARLLESTPRLETRAAFLCSDTWADALEALKHNREILQRHGLIVFPQVKVGSYRSDFLLVARSRNACEGWHQNRNHAFFIECDGQEFHGADCVSRDLVRENWIRSQTNLDVLHFSGAEIRFKSDWVATVLVAKIELLSALQECVRFGIPFQSIQNVDHCIKELTSHPQLRRQFQQYNVALSADLDNHYELNGDDAILAETKYLGPFERLFDALSQLRSAIAYRRLAIRRTNGPHYDDCGDLRPMRHLGDVVGKVAHRTFTKYV